MARGICLAGITGKAVALTGMVGAGLEDSAFAAKRRQATTPISSDEGRNTEIPNTSAQMYRGGSQNGRTRSRED
jgi:hypothetical protein